MASDERYKIIISPFVCQIIDRKIIAELILRFCVLILSLQNGLLGLKSYVYYKNMQLSKSKELSQEVSAVFQALSESVDVENGFFDANEQVDVSRILSCSLFIQKQVIRFPRIALALIQKEPDVGDVELLAELTEKVALIVEERDLMRVLRQFRQQHMLRIAWADLSGAEVEVVLQKLSYLADILIRHVVDWTYRFACKRYGIPRDVLGVEQKLIVIGMGKLGAYELNFSSDIDLIFCYPSAGETDGRRAISNEEFFTRMCRQVVKLLDQQTVDGFVFRVDTRLRPFGDSGALSLNFDAMENYYQSHAREWERYAMVKARPITGDDEECRYLMSLLHSFVYRRYLDYGVFDSIRVMKRQIEEQLGKEGIEHNVKLGPGGIREIEFIGQAYQLIRGGRDKSLQVLSIVKALKLLVEKGHIESEAGESLINDYYFLRRLENHIQEVDDKQTHDLPQDDLTQQRLALSMQCEDWPTLLGQTKETMGRVHHYFNTLVDFAPVSDKSNEVSWLDGDEAALKEYFDKKSIGTETTAVIDLLAFCHSYPVRQLQEKGRQYLARLLPMLIDALLIERSSVRTFSAFLNMLEKICNRVAYLVLLVENKAVFNHLVQLAVLSPWIVTQVTKSPVLLDELIDPNSLFHVPTKAELKKELELALSNVQKGDTEEQMEALRHFKQANVLRVAASDLTGVIPVMIVSDKLTDIAEVLVEKALALSWESVCSTFGVPAGAADDVVSGFAIIGFGKMGGIELGFSSDLDVVFIHKETDMSEHTVGSRQVTLVEFYMRLARKFITMVNTKTFSGQLYELDLRLRPNGQSGLLVTSGSAFQQYQTKKAWTWELQALVRARFVAGCAKTGQVFAGIRQAVLSVQRDRDALKKDVLDMREKMREALLKTKEDCFDLKHGVGGIVDIEFIVQFGVLANASQHDSLLVYTDNIRLLEALKEIGFLTDQQQVILSDAYKCYREASHHAALAEKSTELEKGLFKQSIQKVESIWNELILNN